MTQKRLLCTFLLLCAMVLVIAGIASGEQSIPALKHIPGTNSDSRALDAAVVTITWPEHWLGINASGDPTGIYANFGMQQASFDVHFEIDSSGTNIYTGDVQSIMLDPNTETTWVFTPPWTSGPNYGTIYDLRTYVVLAGDSNTTNDTLTRPIGGSCQSVWEPRSSMPIPEMCHATAHDITGNCLYTIGGYHGGSIYHGYTQQYQIDNDSWQIFPAMPSARAWIDASVTQWNRNIYVFGGFDGSVHNDNYFYDIENEIWHTGTSMPHARSAGEQLVYNDSLIYYLGGYDDSTATIDVQLYNTYTDVWTTGTPLPGPHMMGGALIINDTIWIVGGHDGMDPHAQLYYGAIFPSSCETITWYTGDSLPYPVCSNGVGTRPGTSLIFLVGGLIDGTAPSRLCWQYGPSYSWMPFDTLPCYPVLRNISLPSNNDFLFLCGGDHTGSWNPINEVWAYYFF